MADRTTLESLPLQDDEGAWLAVIEATQGRRRKPKRQPERSALMLSNERGRRRCAAGAAARPGRERCRRGA
jgi:hypothetical protein